VRSAAPGTTHAADELDVGLAVQRLCLPVELDRLLGRLLRGVRSRLHGRRVFGLPRVDVELLVALGVTVRLVCGRGPVTVAVVVGSVACSAEGAALVSSRAALRAVAPTARILALLCPAPRDAAAAGGARAPSSSWGSWLSAVARPPTSPTSTFVKRPATTPGLAFSTPGLPGAFLARRGCAKQRALA
jgi:hypothetical protein